MYRGDAWGFTFGVTGRKDRIDQRMLIGRSFVVFGAEDVAMFFYHCKLEVQMRKSLLCIYICFIASLLLTSCAVPPPIPIGKIKELGECIPCNLAKADLKGVDFSGVNLDEATFENANCTDMNLTRAYLDHAVFRGANLTNAMLKKADMEKCDFTGADLTNASLAGAKLAHADFTNAIINKTDFSFTDLEQADFSALKLEGANFRGASFKRTRIIGATFTNANLSGADLRGAIYAVDLSIPTRPGIVYRSILPDELKKQGAIFDSSTKFW